MFKSIVVAIDTHQPGSCQHSISQAVALAGEGQSQITLATVVPDFRAIIDAEWSAIGFRQMADEAHATLVQLKGQLPANFDAKTEVGSGSIWRGIVDIAERVHADLIVLSSHPPEVKDYLLGTNATRIVMHAPCSVLVVRK
jgi:nucleotide-binding universal stress UspA family protein